MNLGIFLLCILGVHGNIQYSVNETASYGGDWIHVCTGDNGCNTCHIDVTIYDNEGRSCNTGHLNSNENDWKKHQCRDYTGEDLGSCDNFINRAWDDQNGCDIGIKLKVKHSKSDGVRIEDWILCPKGVTHGWFCRDGNWYDSDDEHEVTCATCHVWPFEQCLCSE